MGPRIDPLKQTKLFSSRQKQKEGFDSSVTFRQHDLMADSHELCLARCTLAEVWGAEK